MLGRIYNSPVVPKLLADKTALVTNIAPSKELFEGMAITPMSTLIKGVTKFVGDPSLNGELAEIHGESATLRPPHDYVDEDSRKNLERFWSLGYA